jgi:hypothetical protein
VTRAFAGALALAALGGCAGAPAARITGAWLDAIDGRASGRPPVLVPLRVVTQPTR